MIQTWEVQLQVPDDKPDAVEAGFIREALTPMPYGATVHMVVLISKGD